LTFNIGHAKKMLIMEHMSSSLHPDCRRTLVAIAFSSITIGELTMKKILQFSLVVLFITTSMDTSLAQWVQTDQLNGGVFSLAALDSSVLAGTWLCGAYLSTDCGKSWTAVDSGLTTTDVRAFAFSDTNAFAGTYGGGVFLSTNWGTSWTPVDSGLGSMDIQAMVVSRKNVIAGTITPGGIFVSRNSGTTWTRADLGLDGIFSSYFYFEALAVMGANVYAGSVANSIGVWVSTDDGMTWTESNSGLTNTDVKAFAISGTNLFVGTFGGGVFLSTDKGETWTAVDSGLTDLNVLSLATSGTNLFAGTDYGGVFLSTNNGITWTAADSGVINNMSVQALTVSGPYLLAGIIGSGGGIWRRTLSEMITSVKSATSNVAPRFILDQNFPNPFNPSTVISYQLPTNALVVLKVFDVLGREVETLVHARQNAGSHSVTFDATNLPSGVYFYRLKAGTYHDTKKLLLLK
jgi:hypothetical protein